MSNFIIVSDASNCSFRDLLNTGKSLLASLISPTHWLISGSPMQLLKIQNHRLLRKSGMTITDKLSDPDHSTVVFLRAGDTLAPDALSLIEQHTDLHDVIYGDSAHGRARKFEEPSKARRPQWSPERLRSHNYVGDLLVASQSVVAAAGGISTLATLHEHDRSLRIFEVCTSPHRIADVLYHSSQERMVPTASLSAVQQHCTRTGIDAVCSISQELQSVRVSRRLHSQPKISVIVPTRGTAETIKGKQVVLAAHTIEALINNSTYQNFDVIAVLDSVTTSEGRQAIVDAGGSRLKIVDYDRPFNFAEKINLGAVCSDADLLLLLNDDTEIITPDALETLLGILEDQTVGMAGPMLLYEDMTIQSAGHILNPVPFDLYRERELTCTGAQRLLQVQREASGLIAACVLVKRSVFDEVGGLCTLFPSNYNDVDFGLKIQDAGYRVVWTPHAQFHHFESKTRTPKLQTFEVATIGARWRDKLEDDPYFNPHLERYIDVWKENVMGQRSVLDALGPTAPIASK
jgi:GT2 family glycosyltransferase